MATIPSTPLPFLLTSLETTTYRWLQVVKTFSSHANAFESDVFSCFPVASEFYQEVVDHLPCSRCRAHSKRAYSVSYRLVTASILPCVTRPTCLPPVTAYVVCFCFVDTVDDEDEVLWALAEQLSVTFLPLVGGKDYVHVLLVSPRPCIRNFK
jgi:hypothetical protein